MRYEENDTGIPIPEVSIFINSAHLKVINVPTNYHFHPGKEGFEYNSEFDVTEDGSLLIPDLSSTSLSKKHYRYFHALSTAMSLSAIKSSTFPGARGENNAFSFEYADDIKSHSLTRNILGLITKEVHKPVVTVLDVGGQEGNWINMLQLQAYGFSIEPTIVDLDLYRRFPNRFPQQGSDSQKIKYIQADAHHLQSVWKAAHPDETPKALDIIAFMNTGNVIFDPFTAFKQAWDMLGKDGLLIIGSSFSDIGIMVPGI